MNFLSYADVFPVETGSCPSLLLILNSLYIKTQTQNLILSVGRGIFILKRLIGQKDWSAR